MLGKTLRLMLIGFLITAAPSVVGAATGQAEEEIAHLLDTIARSPCRFIRNGVEYEAGEAHAHILKKYGYAKPWIKSAEDFIRLAATKSSTSGEPYRISCNDEVVLCADWLREALERYRQAGTRGSK